MLNYPSYPLNERYRYHWDRAMMQSRFMSLSKGLIVVLNLPKVKGAPSPNVECLDCVGDAEFYKSCYKRAIYPCR